LVEVHDLANPEALQLLHKVYPEPLGVGGDGIGFPVDRGAETEGQAEYIVL
jgi:hypothetical protein